MRCAVFGCTSDNQSKKRPIAPDIKFYTFPKDVSLLKQWVHATGRKDKFNVKYATVCSKHFLSGDYKVNLQHELLGYTPKRYRGLKEDAVPSKELPISPSISAETVLSRTRRAARILKKESKETVRQLLKSSPSVNVNIDGFGDKRLAEANIVSDTNMQKICNQTATAQTQTDITMKEIQDLRDQVEQLKSSNKKLQSMLAPVEKVSKNQTAKLKSEKRTKWSTSEVHYGIVMYAAGS